MAAAKSIEPVPQRRARLHAPRARRPRPASPPRARRHRDAEGPAHRHPRPGRGAHRQPDRLLPLRRGRPGHALAAGLVHQHRGAGCAPRRGPVPTTRSTGPASGPTASGRARPVDPQRLRLGSRAGRGCPRGTRRSSASSPCRWSAPAGSVPSSASGTSPPTTTRRTSPTSPRWPTWPGTSRPASAPRRRSPPPRPATAPCSTRCGTASSWWTWTATIREFNEALPEDARVAADELRTKTYRDAHPERWHAAEAKVVSEQVLPGATPRSTRRSTGASDGTVFPVELADRS